MSVRIRFIDHRGEVAFSGVFDMHYEAGLLTFQDSKRMRAYRKDEMRGFFVEMAE
jgi:hypothetical protein